ncbi:MAG: PQQ-dependent sugar dehydrogenase [Verrucomicrobiales bacterium]
MKDARRVRLFCGLFLLSQAVITTALRAVEPVREPWTTSRVQGTPEPPKPYVPEPVFGNLNIENGLEMVALDGRLFVMERTGKVWSFPEKPTADKADLFIDLKSLHTETTNAYGMAVHPGWRKNGEVYLAYTVGNGLDDGSRLSRFRFTFSHPKPPRIDPESEEILLTWLSGGHNGANLRFGPDGMLYVSTGDAAPPNPPDQFDTGQDNSDLLSCVLRINVDEADDGKRYRVPLDNPFVDRKNVRPEIWAFGFRNPWKMSFDTGGRLWVGDVGWELWEMIHLVEKGGNYGWSAMEASNPIKPETASDLAPIAPPVAAHPHTEAASITGGFEYRGKRLAELQGAYIYGDYETGMIWALRHDGEQVIEHTVIADTPHKISTFGTGNEGTLYYIHYGVPSTIYRLTPNPRAGQPSEFPRKLSETGLFSDVGEHRPAAGVYEFEIHEPMWEDGAKATRYIALPEESGIETEYEYRPNGDFRRSRTTWPENAVLARTIRLGERPVETQMLHFDGNAWAGYSYRWDEAATDAELVGAEGDEFEVPQAGWKGGTRYRIASRAECMRCHNMWNQFTPAFEPMQLAGFPAFPRQPAREVAIPLGLANALFFHKDEGKGHLAASRGSGSIDKRARSWLHANCAHCHRRHGGGSAPLEVNFDRALSESFLLWQAPTRGDFGLTDAHVIVPGDPARSVLQYRVSAIGSGHMPPIGPREVDAHGAKLLWDWIAKMPTRQDTGGDSTGYGETSAALAAAHRIATEKSDDEDEDISAAFESGLGSSNANVRAIFDRFRLPEERPSPRKLDLERVLDLAGNAENGAKLLFPAGKLASCLACHRVGEAGGALGPDLTGVGSRLNREQLLESLSEPSKTIAPEYRVWTVETGSGEVFSGFLAETNDQATTLKLATGQERRIPAIEIVSTRVQPLSLMPEGLLNLLSDQETADLLSYLQSLKR